MLLKHNPYNKVTGCVFDCLSVPKDLTNRRMALLFCEASIGPGEILTFMGEGASTPH